MRINQLEVRKDAGDIPLPSHFFQRADTLYSLLETNAHNPPDNKRNG